jgi:hypothetical protein
MIEMIIAIMVVVFLYGGLYYINKRDQKRQYYNATCNERHIEFDAWGKVTLKTRIDYDYLEVKRAP